MKLCLLLSLVAGLSLVDAFKCYRCTTDKYRNLPDSFPMPDKACQENPENYLAECPEEEATESRFLGTVFGENFNKGPLAPAPLNGTHQHGCYKLTIERPGCGSKAVFRGCFSDFGIAVPSESCYDRLDMGFVISECYSFAEGSNGNTGWNSV